MKTEYITIAEVAYFMRKASCLLTEEELTTLKSILATNPKAGDIIQGSHGLRKLRFATGNKGKSGGVRVIYYFYDTSVPLYLIDVFPKSQKDNLSKSELQQLAKLAELLKKASKR